ncbi:P-loop NTPase fold protein [Leptotrichia alba]|uniref:P-loop NTPase fold protein n=1 Tax=Leptotrichia alba TaxID=3239304 RepID=A0AB39V1N7_9FUSO
MKKKIIFKKIFEWFLINIPIAFFINEILGDKKNIITFSNWIILFLLILPFVIVTLKKKLKIEKYLFDYLEYFFSVVCIQIIIYKSKKYDNIQDFMIILYCWILITILFSDFILRYIEKYENNDSDNVNKIGSNLINSREQDLDNLKNILDNTLDSIIIDDKWGNGKTFFIKKFMEKYNTNYDFIYIKAPYFQTREEFRKVFLAELNKVFIKNGIFNTSISNLTKYFGVEIQGITLNQIEKNYNETIEEIVKKMCKLNKRIVIVLDDLDRIEKGEDIQEIFSFIGEINTELREKIGLITLSSYNKLNEKVQSHTEDKEGENYLDKYFDKKFYLQKVNIEELIEYFCEDENLSKIIKQCKKAIEEHYLLFFNSEIEDGKFEKEKKQNKIYLSKQTFRNIERLIKNININVKEIIENKEIYEKIFILFEIFELLLPESWENLKIDSKMESLLDNIFIYKDNPEINFEGYNQFIYSCANEVLNYKKSKTQNYFSKYQNIKNFITEKYINNDENILIEEYLETAKIFKFSEDEKKEILDFFIIDNKISKYDFIQLYIQFELNYKLYLDDITTFIEIINNKSNNCGSTYINKYLLIREFCKFLYSLSLISLKEFSDIIKLIETNNTNLPEEKIFEKFNQHKNKQEIYKILNFISEIYNETFQPSKYNTLNSNIKIGIENFKFNDDVNPLLKAFKEAENEYKEDAWITILGMRFDFIVDIENSFNQDDLNLDIESKKYLDKFYKNKKLVNHVKILRENSIIKANVHYIIKLNILRLDLKEINPTIKEITDRLKNNKVNIENFKKKLKEENKDKYKEWEDILNELKTK